MVRSRGFSASEAEDLVQGFFLRFLQSNAIARAHPRKGRFRDFLTGALDHYLADVCRQTGRQKRGGDVERVPLDDVIIGDTSQLQFCLPPTEINLQCDQDWAAELLSRVMKDLKSEYVRSGRGKIFRALKAYVFGEDEPLATSWSIALQLGSSPTALRKTAEKMRARFREKLREALCQRVGRARVEEELENLREILRSRSR